MQDTTQVSVESFKTTLFIWEVVITAVVFTAAYFVLKGFKNKEKAAREKNKRFYGGE